MGGHAALSVGGHAPQHLHKFAGVMLRSHDSLQRVATGAVQKHLLLFHCPGHADQPLPVGELAREVSGLVQLQIELRRLLGGHLHRPWIVHLVSNGPDAHGIFSRLQPAPREAVPPLSVAYHRERDRRSRALGAHQHALHGAFLLRSHAAPKRRGG